MKALYSIIFLSVVAIILSFLVGAFYAYFYPMAYKDKIVEYGNLYQVDSAIIASVANVESGFNEEAKSNKGALGIMQLMPSTAQWLAGKMNEKYSEEMLLEGEYSIKLGSFYLSYLFNQFGDMQTALCAYNAGQGKVKNWLSIKEYSNDGKTLDKIPFEETKNYLNKVYKNYHYYKLKYKNSLK